MYKHLTHQELYYIWQHRINKFGDNNKHISTIYRVVKHMRETNWSPDSKVRHRERQ